MNDIECREYSIHTNKKTLLYCLFYSYMDTTKSVRTSITVCLTKHIGCINSRVHTKYFPVFNLLYCYRVTMIYNLPLNDLTYCTIHLFCL